MNPSEVMSSTPRVLIVEDDKEYALVLMRALRDADAIDPSLPSMRFEVDITDDPNTAMRHAKRDDIDIYIMDLKLPTEQNSYDDNADIGRRLVREVRETTKAGLIVHSTEPAQNRNGKLDWLGADDYIEKMSRAEFQHTSVRKISGTGFQYLDPIKVSQVVRAKTEALWRLVQLTRPNSFANFVHANRSFRLGNWLFTVGSRDMTDEKGTNVRLSQTEHAFMRFLCTVEGHEIDQEEFNVAILGRTPSHKDSRMKNIVHRLNNKFGPTLGLRSVRGDGYKLIGVEEVRS